MGVGSQPVFFYSDMPGRGNNLDDESSTNLLSRGNRLNSLDIESDGKIKREAVDGTSLISRDGAIVEGWVVDGSGRERECDYGSWGKKSHDNWGG
jgi:hypothetical protein